MSSIVSRAISSFTGGLDYDQLAASIKDLSFASSLVSISSGDGETISVMFDTILTSDNITSLNTVLDSHAPDLYKSRSTYSPIRLTFQKNVSTASYFLAGQIDYPGRSVTGTPSNVKIIYSVDTPTTIGSIRFYDITNHNILFEDTTTLTSTIPTSVSIPTINGELWPISPATIYVQIKRTSDTPGAKVNFFSVTIEF
jgi:hypothetical protein